TTLVSFTHIYIWPISSTFLLHRIVPLSLCFPPLGACFIYFIRSPLLHARHTYHVAWCMFLDTVVVFYWMD
ncbi:uncharacterized protein EDB93DRAFT_1145096, partial [Suillus bovinus]|uniref:uncharacterized protein n=1 Tax=Suillus bovinus TaxID=48563 RepID=UPI001B86E76A